MAISGSIKTIVVLVQENRSFDHMLGWMKQLNPEINGVTGEQWNPISTADPNSAKVFFQNKAEYVDPDPGHSYQEIREQIFGNSTDTSADPPPMNGFAQQAESIEKGMSQTVMNGFRPEALPVYKALVSEFAVFDRWFASVPASTQPNRLYVHSATSHGAMSNESKKLIEGYPQKTIFDSIAESGLDFGIYYQYPPSTLFYRNLRKLKYTTKFHPYDLEFKSHAKHGKLPNYVVIEQRYYDLKLLPGNDDHPSKDVGEGQKFVKEVYEVLRSSPQWNEMLFIITYDEHGGFYDHVPTPVKNVPSPDDIVGLEPYYFKFDRLGVRVPTIMISPWINKGTVVHGPNGPYPSSEFEHSSIPATVKKIFNLKSGFLTKRDAWAGTFEGILQLRDSPRTDCPAKGWLPVLLSGGCNEMPKMPVTEPQCAENEKQNHTGRGDGLWRVCSLEDIRKKLLRWERSPTALEAEAKVLPWEKPFSGSLNGNENEGFSSRNGGGDGPCVFQMPVDYPRYSKADYESMPEWKLDNLFHEYGLPIRGDVAFRRSYAMGNFLWPNQL